MIDWLIDSNVWLKQDEENLELYHMLNIAVEISDNLLSVRYGENLFLVFELFQFDESYFFPESIF